MKRITLLLFILLHQLTFAQEYFRTNENGIVLDNGTVTRQITLANDSVYSSHLSVTPDTINYILNSPEFSLLVNGEEVNGFSGWRLKDQRAIQDTTGGRGVKLTLEKKNGSLQVTLYYLLYPNLPIIRKWIDIVNLGSQDISIEALNVEDLTTQLSHITSQVYHNYARMKHLGRFVGNWDDPLVVVHDMKQRKGVALGNEAVGVIKRTAYHTTRNNVTIGMTHPGQNFPFRKWLAPDESWTSFKTFIALYSQTDNGFEVVEDEVNRFIIQHMKPRILQLKEKPTFVYNTWNPFRTFVNDSLMREVATAAAECGIEEFIIDDGWQVNDQGESSTKKWGGNYGDWLVDENKFENGLRPTFDYIQSLGMKPGLWVSIASATEDSRVFSEHPEWFVQQPDGTPGNLHYESESGSFYSASFGTDWYDYIKETIVRLVGTYGLAYAKLDLAVVTSPYVNNDSISGSYATDHPYYRDHHESFLVIYERLLQLFDELHREAPNLFIDCTFETAGKLHLMDYAIAQHAEGNWLSNFEEASPLGPLRVRQLAWWRSPVLPASSLVIGNLPMNDPDFIFGLKSLIGTLPIVLGDPREISSERRKLIKDWSDWMQTMQQKYDYMSYRKDLAGFGEPADGSWDGWQRVNFQTQAGGIFGVFRQGALEDTRRVFLKDLQLSAQYVIKLAPHEEVVHQATGEALMKEGFAVSISEEYGGNIYEVGLE